MAHCFNPDCAKPENSDRAQFCHHCGQGLLLNERYYALQPLGQGGFGRTFLGVDRHLPNQPRCVIKQLFFQTQNPAMRDKAIALFQQEAQQLSTLGSHPQIPTLAAYFEAQGQLYLVQEWINGQPLNASIWSQHPHLESMVWQLLRDILPVLEFIHEQKVIHRDIKPDNIMQRRSTGQFILIDFGIARMLTDTAMMGGATVIGTPGFMAPEQLRGRVLPASDLYSLGTTCLNLITGVNPEELFDIVNDRWQWRDRIPSHQHLSLDLIRIVNQLINPSLRERPQSATVVLREIGADIANAPTLNNPTPNPAPLISDIPTVALPPSRPASKTPPATTKTTLDPDLLALKQKLETPVEPVRIDYSNLQTALKRKQWEAADDETWAILCRLTRKRVGSYLFLNEIEALPCADLRAIDFLWAKYSEKRFGFKVQILMFKAAQNNYPEFCHQVDWPPHDVSRHNYLKYHPRAPVGHLPSRRWIGGSKWWKHLEMIAQRFEQCGFL